MRYGMCMGIDSPQNVKIAKDAGFDYMECGFSLLSRADEEMFQCFKKALKDSDIKCEAANCFLPGDLPVIGHNFSDKEYVEYIEKGMARGKEIGLEVIVFGSSAARNVPDGISFAEGFRQLGDFLKTVVSPIAEKYGMNKEVVYPHSFRHRFAKNFLDRFNDLALLADLMGHESIETTRIYLRRTASEQQKIVDKVVNW